MGFIPVSLVLVKGKVKEINPPIGTYLGREDEKHKRKRKNGEGIEEMEREKEEKVCVFVCMAERERKRDRGKKRDHGTSNSDILCWEGTFKHYRKRKSSDTGLGILTLL
jgi:hypothetical protein